MLIRDVMTTDMITVSPSAAMADVRRLMDSHRIRRIPVMDEGRLVGLVTRNAVEREMSSMLSTLTAGDMMVVNLVTVSSETTVEEGVALAQSKKVGGVLVVDQGRLAGIATTNDFFYKILNPILGIGMAGTRISVQNCGGAKDIENVLRVVNNLKVDIATMYTMPRPRSPGLLFTVHLATEDAAPVVNELRRHGWVVETRAR